VTAVERQRGRAVGTDQEHGAAGVDHDVVTAGDQDGPAGDGEGDRAVVVEQHALQEHARRGPRPYDACGQRRGTCRAPAVRARSSVPTKRQDDA
jgi:hypothetical protein